jgi:hypothetical protein
VVIRTFTQSLSAAQRERFRAALVALCAAPLEHPSIARPIASGLQNDQPYVVHTYLPGTSLADFAAASGDRGFDEIVKRLTYLAGALDFAAATGVLHGALSPADIILSSDSAGVAGLGLAQALESAGVEGVHARREDDVAALMDVARLLLGRQASPAVESLLSGPATSSALAFAAALHRTIDADVPVVTAPPRVKHAELPFSDPDDFAPEPHKAPAPVAHDLSDIQLRQDSPRHDEADLADRVMFGAVDPPASGRSGRRVWSWLLMGGLALALGIVVGYAGGFFVAPYTDVPAPVVQTEAPKPQPEPTPTNGQTYTDAAVEDLAKPPAARSGEEPPPAPEVQAPEVQTPPPVAAAPRPRPEQRPVPPAAASVRPPEVTPPARSGPAAIRVDSRPVGAQVFVDGRSVGYTPLVVGELTPGTHSIRMQHPGYRPWVTAVTLAPGARERIAASLEQ